MYKDTSNIQKITPINLPEMKWLDLAQTPSLKYDWNLCNQKGLPDAQISKPQEQNLTKKSYTGNSSINAYSPFYIVKLMENWKYLLNKPLELEKGKTDIM